MLLVQTKDLQQVVLHICSDRLLKKRGLHMFPAPLFSHVKGYAAPLKCLESLVYYRRCYLICRSFSCEDRVFVQI